MTEPKMTCQLCKRAVTVVRDARGFPPDTAKRKLQRICAEANCECKPKYRAGLIIGPPVQGQ